MRITDRQLRKIIREELIREGAASSAANVAKSAMRASISRSYSSANGTELNPGSALSSVSKKGRLSTVVSELTKTNEWFTDKVFPAVELGMWPIVADQDYAIEFLSGSAAGDADPDMNKIYIKRGTTFSNVDEKKELGFTGGTGRSPMSLIEMYETLEEIVVAFKLDVPMQSFPD